ncbi:MAG: polyprenyl synthetase family protein [Candidatus Omnitrophota bacterium]
MANNKSLETIYRPIRKDLDAFSRRLDSILEPDEPLLGPLERHLRRSSGKFLRPAMAILSYRLSGGGGSRIIRLAAALELLHTATLIHDDIMDTSQYRRGHPTVWARYGTNLSIIAGDYLFSKAFAALNELNDRRLGPTLVCCAKTMCLGQALQIRLRGGDVPKTSVYLKTIEQKTASLFEAACVSGAQLAGGTPAFIRRMRVYGHNLGMAFQIVDDCLDFTGQRPLMGKSSGTDLLKQDLTLPVILFLGKRRGSHRRSILSKKLPWLRDAIKSSGAIDGSMDLARDYCRRAQDCLTVSGHNIFARALKQLPDYCLARQS